MTTDPTRIGFLADTHSNKADGSDLPDQVIDAFAAARVDLIVHLGDIGRKAILDRLGAVAPVLVPFGGNKGYVPAGAADDVAPVKTINGGGGRVRVGLAFNLAQPDKKIVVEDDRIVFPDAPLADLLRRRFRDAVDAVAFGGTHRQLQQVHDGVLFFNPGSPTLPSDKRSDADLGSVAVLDLSKPKAGPRVDLVRLSR